MVIYNVTDPQFRKYGRIIKNVDFTELITVMKTTPITEGVVYEASVKELEELDAARKIEDVFYGELPIQIGYCNGHNVMLNALEYHRSSEINVAATDAILLLGLESDIQDDYTYETEKIEAFLLPAGTAVEVYATTLHYAPCQASEDGFQVSIILPRGTNTELNTAHSTDLGRDEDAMLTAKNKWLIGHPEGGLPEGTHIGLIGKNLNVTE